MRPLIVMNGENIDWFHTVIRMLMYLAGVAILALGMSLQTASGLGVAALTCFATTLSMLTGKTLGFWITATYVAYILAQLAILRREFQPRILLELCFSTLIGGFTDFFMAVNPLHPTALPAQVATMLLSLAVTAFGVSLVVNMGVVPNAPDGLVQVIAETPLWRRKSRVRLLTCRRVPHSVARAHAQPRRLWRDHSHLGAVLGPRHQRRQQALRPALYPRGIRIIAPP